jgi:hypothetical protein
LSQAREKPRQKWKASRDVEGKTFCLDTLLIE